MSADTSDDDDGEGGDCDDDGVLVYERDDGEEGEGKIWGRNGVQAGRRAGDMEKKRV